MARSMAFHRAARELEAFVMELLMLVEKFGGGLLGLARSAWQGRRFAAHVTVSLSWEHLPIMTIPGPNPRWRAVSITITAPKKEELVVARGVIEVKAGSRGSWAKVGELDDVLTLPVVVEANRQREETVSGESLARLLNASFALDGAATLRFTLEDLHKGKVRSNSLSVTLRELQRKENF